MIRFAGLQETQPDSWFAIWTESRAEKKVEERIAALGLSSLLPTIKEPRRWSDRWREVVTPLFPGYLFARGGAVEWHAVLRTRMATLRDFAMPSTVRGLCLIGRGVAFTIGSALAKASLAR